MDSKHNYDILIKGGKILTMDADRRVIDNGAVAIRGNKIALVCAADELPENLQANEIIQAEGKVVIPGMINAHSHLAMTLFRGFVEDLSLHKWLERVWKYEFTVLNEDSIRAGSKLAFAEMIRSGVTCAHDMYWYYMATSDLAEEIGFNLISGPPITIIGEPDFNEMLNKARNALEQLGNYHFVHPIIQSHSAYTTTPELMQKVYEFKQEYNVPFTTHASENQEEINVVNEKYGQTPIELLQSYHLLDKGTVLAHCVKLQDYEIEMLAESQTNVVHCPESNLKLGSGIARVAEMIQAGINVALGTDGAASNNDLNMLGEIHTAALLQKGYYENPEVLTTIQALEMATINGAKAYGLDDKFGSLEPDKRADIVLLNFDKSHLTPCFDIYAHLVYSVDKADVDTVLIDGKIQLQNGQLTSIDEEATIAEVRKIGEQFK
jgi:5-methylthioadenosine/S-adenosylhomocysteine deaminase